MSDKRKIVFGEPEWDAPPDPVVDAALEALAALDRHNDRFIIAIDSTPTEETP